MPESVPLTGSRGPATQLRRPEPSLVPLAPAVPSSWATAKPHAETFCAQLLVTLSCAGGGRNRLRCLCCHHLLPEHSTWPWPRALQWAGTLTWNVPPPTPGFLLTLQFLCTCVEGQHGREAQRRSPPASSAAWTYLPSHTSPGERRPGEGTKGLFYPRWATHCTRCPWERGQVTHCPQPRFAQETGKVIRPGGRAAPC